MHIKRVHRFILAGLSGILFSLAFSQWHLGPVLFIAFIPLLVVEDFFYRNKQRYKSIQVFFYAYISFFVWNLINTWWIYYASLPGAAGAILLNALFMAIVFMVFHMVRRRLGNKFGYFSLIVFWLGFELLHLNWDLSWSWLTIGNGFSRNISLIQWYDITGVLGGSLWVLLMNVVLFKIIREYHGRKKIKFQKPDILILVLILIIPLVVSYVKYFGYTEKEQSYEMVVLQPNIDPYNDKFNGMTEQEQLEILLQLADSLVTENTRFVIGPETALPRGFFERNVNTDTNIKLIRAFLERHPHVRFILGASTNRRYLEGEELSQTVRQNIEYIYDEGGIYDTIIHYYDAYNTSVQLEKEDYQFYHKSKLVIGVETTPFPEVFQLLGGIVVDMGGTSGSLGIQDNREVFISENDTIKVGVPVCYESIFGEYLAEWINNNAHFIFVITNDGWWEDTPGYRQHLSYSSLRSIETRRSIARSANTGISCFINQKGEIIQPTSWWVRTAIRGEINANDHVTYYVRHGDYIGRVAQFFAVIMLLYLIVNRIMNRKKTLLS